MGPLGSRILRPDVPLDPAQQARALEPPAQLAPLEPAYDAQKEPLRPMVGLDLLAQYAASQLPAIDFAKVVWWKGEQYPILAAEAVAADQATASVRTERIDAKDAQGAYAAIRAILKAHGDDIRREVERANPSLSTPIEMGANSVRDIVTVSYYAALYGMDLHKPENVLPLYQKGVLTEKQIKRDANLRHAIFRALLLLGEYGVYEQLRAHSSTKGLGWVQGVLVTIGSVIAAAILAWLILAIYDISRTNDIIEKMCTEAQASKDPAQLQMCFELLGQKREKYAWIPGVGNGAAGGGKSDQLFESLIKWGSIGVIGYLGVTQLMPWLLRRGQKSSGGGGGEEPVTVRITRR